VITRVLRNFDHPLSIIQPFNSAFLQKKKDFQGFPFLRPRFEGGLPELLIPPTSESEKCSCSRRKKQSLAVLKFLEYLSENSRLGSPAGNRNCRDGGEREEAKHPRIVQNQSTDEEIRKAARQPLHRLRCVKPQKLS
jgi:hypothetical protein